MILHILTKISNCLLQGWFANTQSATNIKYLSQQCPDFVNHRHNYYVHFIRLNPVCDRMELISSLFNKQISKIKTVNKIAKSFQTKQNSQQKDNSWWVWGLSSWDVYPSRDWKIFLTLTGKMCCPDVEQMKSHWCRISASHPSVGIGEFILQVVGLIVIIV